MRRPSIRMERSIGQKRTARARDIEAQCPRPPAPSSSKTGGTHEGHKERAKSAKPTFRVEIRPKEQKVSPPQCRGIKSALKGLCAAGRSKGAEISPPAPPFALVPLPCPPSFARCAARPSGGRRRWHRLPPVSCPSAGTGRTILTQKTLKFHPPAPPMPRSP